MASLATITRGLVASALVNSGLAQDTAALPSASTEVRDCNFTVAPVGIGYYWDPNCQMGDLGCKADGQNLQCRMCGAAQYINVSCPASVCTFAQPPYTPYYWDKDCEVGMLGCWADGVHAQCRFCGDHPYTGIACPEGAAPPLAASCDFDNEPEDPYYWEPACTMGMHGCNADGRNVQCRFCGHGGFTDIHCPGSHVCEFAVLPTVPYYWDPDCVNGGLGCMADGINPQCRYCAERPFENVTCPVHVAPPENQCSWPQQGTPSVPHYWDESCQMGMLGCWADGQHAQCRFCGEGVYESISCPNATSTDGGRRLRGVFVV